MAPWTEAEADGKYIVGFRWATRLCHMFFQLWSLISQVNDNGRSLVSHAPKVQGVPESAGGEEGPEDGAELGDGVVAGKILGEAHPESRRDGTALGRSGDDIVDGLVHAEEVEEDAAVDAQNRVGRQEAGEMLDGLVPPARLHKVGQMVQVDARTRLAGKRVVGVEQLLAPEEGEESPLPEARHAGVLRRTLALAGHGDGEPRPIQVPHGAGTKGLERWGFLL